jgi:hypothetical protein
MDRFTSAPRMLHYDEDDELIFGLPSSHSELSDIGDEAFIVSKSDPAKKTLFGSIVSTANEVLSTNSNNNNKSVPQWNKEEDVTVDNSVDDNSSINDESEVFSDDTSSTNKTNSYEDDEVSDTSDDDLSPAIHQTDLYETKALTLWSKFEGVAATEFVRELKRQWLDAFKTKSFAQKENADVVIMFDYLPKLDNLFLQMKEDLASFASVNANKRHCMANIREELEEFDLEEEDTYIRNRDLKAKKVKGARDLFVMTTKVEVLKFAEKIKWIETEGQAASPKNQKKIVDVNVKCMMEFLEVNAGIYGSCAHTKCENPKDDVNERKRRITDVASPSSPDQKKRAIAVSPPSPSSQSTLY